MKKLINKLFERLGYVPKSKTPHPTNIWNNFVANLENDMIDGYCKYDWYSCEGGYWVYAYSPNSYWLPIKFFPYNDDADYARLCAEELCEKLNERI